MGACVKVRPSMQGRAQVHTFHRNFPALSSNSTLKSDRRVTHGTVWIKQALVHYVDQGPQARKYVRKWTGPPRSGPSAARWIHSSAVDRSTQIFSASFWRLRELVGTMPRSRRLFAQNPRMTRWLFPPPNTSNETFDQVRENTT